jgi:hypothetical protein
MWALDPSVFHVLIRHSKLRDRKFAARYPWLHCTLLGALHTHCSSNGHFLTSSALVHNSASPTSEHFKNILETIADIFDQARLNILARM